MKINIFIIEKNWIKIYTKKNTKIEIIPKILKLNGE